MIIDYNMITIMIMIVKAVIKKNKHTCMNVIEGVISEFRFHTACPQKITCGWVNSYEALSKKYVYQTKIYIFTFIFTTHFQFVAL